MYEVMFTVGKFGSSSNQALDVREVTEELEFFELKIG